MGQRGTVILSYVLLLYIVFLSAAHFVYQNGRSGTNPEIQSVCVGLAQFSTRTQKFKILAGHNYKPIGNDSFSFVKIAVFSHDNSKVK